jgi:hypothetical protein
MRCSILTAWLCAGMVAPLLSATHRVPQEKPVVAISIPDKWHTKEFEEGLQGASSDGSVHFLVVLTETNKTAESIGEAMRYVRNKGGITVKSGSGKRERGMLNGIELLKLSWDGQNSNGRVTIQFAIVSISKKQPLLVAYWGSPQAQRKHRAELDAILKSIKKV